MRSQDESQLQIKMPKFRSVGYTKLISQTNPGIYHKENQMAIQSLLTTLSKRTQIRLPTNSKQYVQTATVHCTFRWMSTKLGDSQRLLVDVLIPIRFVFGFVFLHENFQNHTGKLHLGTLYSYLQTGNIKLFTDYLFVLTLHITTFKKFPVYLASRTC